MDSTYDKQTKIWSGPKRAPLYNVEHYSVGRILYGQMRLHPNTVILIDDFDGTTKTNQEVLTAAKRISLHFKKQGMDHNSIVGIAGRNTPYLTAVILGCFFNCTPYHGVNPNSQEGSMAHSFGLTRPEIIFCDGRDYEKIKVATKSFQPRIYTLIEHIEGVPSVLDLLQPTKEEHSFQPEKLTLGADQTVAILCSSGTTGLPKAVTVSANNVAFDNPIFTSDSVCYTTSEVDWITHFGSTLFNCYTGYTNIISRKPFSVEHFIDVIRKYKVTNIRIPPTQLVALLQCPEFTTENVGSIASLLCSGDYLSLQTLAKFQSILPECFISLRYGFTEIGLVSASWGLQQGNSVGKLVSNIQLRIVDDDGENLEPHNVGEIYVRFPWRWMGYYGNLQETQIMCDSEGWFHSGDLGYMDEEGFLFVVERIKDICWYDNIQYWPSEIESCIRVLPDVIDCCVVAIFDECFGDVAGALVVRAKGGQSTEPEIVEHVKRHLKEPQKQLHNGVYFVDDLPRNANGKLLRRVAKGIFQSLMKCDR